MAKTLLAPTVIDHYITMERSFITLRLCLKQLGQQYLLLMFLWHEVLGYLLRVVGQDKKSKYFVFFLKFQENRAGD